MCGIAGTINCELTQKDIGLISHRGPDSQALISTEFGNNKVYLGHTRLSILDLSEAGNQPMVSDCGNFIIVFNGEIYNHKELRKKVSFKNFKGSSDTETILYYIREFGIDTVKDFNGIFSFGLLDKVKQKLYLVRDFFGVKPIYYYHKGNKVIFSSEIKVIKNNLDYNKELDIKALDSFLTFRYNPAPYTLFKNINKLEAATYLEFDLGGSMKKVNYWNKKQKIDYNISEEEAVIEYKRLLYQAVERQLLSDVPVGLFLSGGLDSAVLGYLMSQKQSKFKTFSVGFEGEGNFNELDDARETSRIINSDHLEILMNEEEYMTTFYKSFYHTEEPIAEPTIPALHHVSSLASKHVKVVLSGQGADEPMAGYKRYKGEKLISDYQLFLSVMPLKIIEKIFPRNSSIERGVYASKFKNELDRFIAIYTLFTPQLKQKLIKPELLYMFNNSQRESFEQIYSKTETKSDSLSKLLYLDTRSLLPDNLLLFNDKTTMANSIENRVPYLDIDLINFLESLPSNFKLKNGITKYIHRKAAEQWLPPSVINRKKRAFETPIGIWFEKELSNTLIQLIDCPNSFSSIYFNKNSVKNMILMHVQKKKDFKKQLFIILSLELWYKNFYNS